MSINDYSNFNRRKFVRVTYTQKVKCKTICKPNSDNVIELPEPLQLYSLDISLGGICFESSSEVEEGTILNFNYTIDNVVYELSAKVMYCILHDDIYRIGVEFTSLSKDVELHIKRLVARLTLGA